MRGLQQSLFLQLWRGRQPGLDQERHVHRPHHRKAGAARRTEPVECAGRLHGQRVASRRLGDRQSRDALLRGRGAGGQQSPDSQLLRAHRQRRDSLPRAGDERSTTRHPARRVAGLGHRTHPRADRRQHEPAADRARTGAGGALELRRSEAARPGCLAARIPRHPGSGFRNGGGPAPANPGRQRNHHRRGRSRLGQCHGQPDGGIGRIQPSAAGHGAVGLFRQVHDREAGGRTPGVGRPEALGVRPKGIPELPGGGTFRYRW